MRECLVVAGDGGRVEPPAAVWAAGTPCSKVLFEQLITEGSNLRTRRNGFSVFWFTHNLWKHVLSESTS